MFSRHAKPVSLALCALVALTALANALPQQVVFEEDFEAGLDGWSQQNLWHLESDTDPCGSQLVPFASGHKGAYFGFPTCTFGGGSNLAGSLTQTTPFHIPSEASAVTLIFNSFDDVECDSCDWDWRFIYLSVDGGVSWTFVGESSQLGWHETQLDISSFAGFDVLIRFNFDAVDGIANEGVGWLVDDVRVVVDGCNVVNSYCSASVNSSGNAGKITAFGSTSISAGNMVLRASNCPPGEVGLFIYGGTQGSNPAGNGTLCLSGQTFRLNPIAMTDNQGKAGRLLNFSSAPLGSGAGQAMPGSTWNFTFGFRDTAGGSAGFNFTNGVEVTFCP